MILKNGGRLVKEFPHIPGIDFAGKVLESENPKFKEYFGGYHKDAVNILQKTFGDVDGYDDMVVEKNITLESHC